MSNIISSEVYMTLWHKLRYSNYSVNTGSLADAIIRLHSSGTSYSLPVYKALTARFHQDLRNYGCSASVAQLQNALFVGGVLQL
jgi:hypothetical protein